MPASVSAGRADADTPNGKAAKAKAGPLTRVMVAEDDPDIRAVIDIALARVGGLDVVCCADGAVALALATRDAPDLILLDVMMPVMDGVETLKCLRADPATAQIPVVFLTARVQPRDLERYYASGALAVIAKPFDPMTLARQLRDLHAKKGREDA
jgi:CheY-like chemotaxis protein